MLYILNINGERVFEVEIPSLKRQPGDTVKTMKQREDLHNSRTTLFWGKYDEYKNKGINFNWAINSSLYHEFFCNEESFNKAKAALHRQGIHSFFPQVLYEPKHYVTENMAENVKAKYISESKHKTLMRQQLKAAERG